MKHKETKITTIIGNGAECNGDFNAEGSVRVDGCINGNVNVTGVLIVGATGQINGDVTANCTVVGGEIYGNVNIADRTELISTARVIGNITTTLIVIDEHAIFQGNCNMNQDVNAKRPRPGYKATRAGKKSAREAIDDALKEAETANRQTDSDSESSDQ